MSVESRQVRLLEHLCALINVEIEISILTKTKQSSIKLLTAVKLLQSIPGVTLLLVHFRLLQFSSGNVF
jgi:hypothetical protein